MRVSTGDSSRLTAWPATVPVSITSTFQVKPGLATRWSRAGILCRRPDVFSPMQAAATPGTFPKSLEIYCPANRRIRVELPSIGRSATGTKSMCVGTYTSNRGKLWRKCCHVSVDSARECDDEDVLNSKPGHSLTHLGDVVIRQFRIYRQAQD